MINIIFLGLVSFFTDFSSEMVYPLIPLYLVSVFGATPALVGVIEGIAESLASLLRVFSGYVTDRYQRKKRLAFTGYAAGLVYKFMLLVATSWFGVLCARIIDRIGKGIRTAPRDVLVSESGDKRTMGKSFGVHKALDMAGSALGILASYLLLRAAAGAFDYKKIFLLSAIPAILGLCMFFFIREKRSERAQKQREPFWKHIKALSPQLKLYLLVAFLFTLGNSSNAFLLLRAKSVGYTDMTVILLYFLYNITTSVLAIPFGRLSDRIGRKSVLIVGYLVFSLVYVMFAFASHATVMVFVFIAYGAYAAMVSGVERAYIAEISPSSLRGTMLGLHATIVGAALLPASAIAGTLWTLFGAAVPFLFGAVLSAAAALILFLFMKEVRTQE